MAVAGCDTPSQVGIEDQPQIVANSISLDLSSFGGVEGRALTLTNEQIAQDISNALRTALASNGEPPNADINLELTAVELTSRGAAFALGGPSRIRGVLTVTDVQTGAVLFGPELFEGNSETLRLPGLIGVATSPSTDADYLQTIDGFAAAVAQELNGP